MHAFFIKCSCQKIRRFIFLKRCNEEKTNGWNKALTGKCLLCLGKNHHFCRAYRATFKLAGSGTSICLAVGFQWMPDKPRQLPRKDSTCCTTCSSPSADRLDRHRPHKLHLPRAASAHLEGGNLQPGPALPAMLQIMFSKCVGSDLKPSPTIWQHQPLIILLQ